VQLADMPSPSQAVTLGLHPAAHTTTTTTNNNNNRMQVSFSSFWKWVVFLKL